MIPFTISIFQNNIENTFNAYRFTSPENIDGRKTLMLNLNIFGNFACNYVVFVLVGVVTDDASAIMPQMTKLVH